MNPYAAHLGDRDPLPVIAATPEKLRSLTATMNAARLEQPRAPGKWSTREVLCHLADCEIAFGFRLRQTLAEENHTVQPFDQDRWARHYAGCSVAVALATFTVLREWNLALIHAAVPAAWNKPLTHPERGPETFRTLVETMAGHDLDHLAQVEAMA